MSMAASFLGGAGSRLLPISIPFRFFIGAAIFHVLAWAALFFGAAELAEFVGGTGMVLAAVHLLTLGVLVQSAIGASYQLLPVVTRQPLVRTWPAVLSFWLFVPGICLLSYGMFDNLPLALNCGAAMASSGLLVFGVLTADNLRRAKSVPIVAAHGWGAMMALLVLVVLGIILILDFESGFLDDHQSVAVIHMGVASFGFMGLLVLGLSQVLIPMFVLSAAPAPRPGWVQLALALAALILFSAGILAKSSLMLSAAVISALLSGIVYIWIMRQAMKASMRKRHGNAFILVQSSWGLLILTLVVGSVNLLTSAIPNGAALFGFLALVGWLLTFLMGVLQRIMPFLASMHAAGRGGKPPLLSELTPELPLKIHMYCHFSALVLCVTGIVLNLSLAVQIGAVIGFAGAISFLSFSILVAVRLKHPQP